MRIILHLANAEQNQCFWEQFVADKVIIGLLKSDPLRFTNVSKLIVRCYQFTCSLVALKWTIDFVFFFNKKKKTSVRKQYRNVWQNFLY